MISRIVLVKGAIRIFIEEYPNQNGILIMGKEDFRKFNQELTHVMPHGTTAGMNIHSFMGFLIAVDYHGAKEGEVKLVKLGEEISYRG